MKVLHLLKGKEAAGIRSYVILVSEALRTQGVELCFAVMQTGSVYDDLKARGFRILFIKKRFSCDFTVIMRLAKVVRNEGIDIIHTHNVTSNFYGRIACLLCPKTCVVTTVHANTYEEHLSSLKSKAMSHIFSNVDLHMAPLSKKLLPISDYLRKVLLAKGMKDNRMVTVLNGLDLKKVNPENSDDIYMLLKELRINEDDKIVATVGRLVPLKNHRMFIDAAKRLIACGYKVKFLIVGDGMLLEGLRRYVQHVGLSEQVIFTGWRDDVEQLYPLLSIYVICSTSEGFGLTVLEAMRCSVPVIATRTGAFPEIVKHGETGLLVEPNDAEALADMMIYLLKRPGRCKEMGRAARKLLEEKFSVSNTAKALCRVYERINQ